MARLSGILITCYAKKKGSVLRCFVLLCDFEVGKRQLVYDKNTNTCSVVMLRQLNSHYMFAESKKNCLTLEDATDWVSRNVGKLPIYAA